MNDRACLRTSTNVWRSLCDHCELMANCIRKPIRHTFATDETNITFETPQKRPRMLTNSNECLTIIIDHYESMANCIRPFATYSPQCETSISHSHIGSYDLWIVRLTDRHCLLRSPTAVYHERLENIDRKSHRRKLCD